MQLVLGLARADSGEALVDGRPYRTIPRPLTAVGALLDAGALHPSRSARSHLVWLARSNGIRPDGRTGCSSSSGSRASRRRRAKALSLGMRQRLGVAAALLGDPPILLLDEPTIGLDPEGIQWMRELLRAFAAEGRTVFVSSHLMSELEGTADHLIVIGRGRLLADVSVAELLADASDGSVEIRTPDATAAMTVLGERRRHGELERAGARRRRGHARGRRRRRCSRPTACRSTGSTSRARRSRRRTSGSRAARASTRGGRSRPPRWATRDRDPPLGVDEAPHAARERSSRSRRLPC